MFSIGISLGTKYFSSKSCVVIDVAVRLDVSTVTFDEVDVLKWCVLEYFDSVTICYCLFGVGVLLLAVLICSSWPLFRIWYSRLFVLLYHLHYVGYVYCLCPAIFPFYYVFLRQ